MHKIFNRRERRLDSKLTKSPARRAPMCLRRKLESLPGLISLYIGRSSNHLSKILLPIALICPGICLGEIIWSGDFDDGTFRSTASNPGNISFWGVPEYGRPVQYGSQYHIGNGDLMWLTSADGAPPYKAGPRRSGKHSLAIFVKSTLGGSREAGDCDTNGNCTRRRTELSTWYKMWADNMAPYMSTRWASISVHVPANFEEIGNGFGPLVWEWKMQEGGGDISPPLAMEIRHGAWRLDMRWSPDVNPTPSSPIYPFILAPTSEPASMEKFMPDPTAAKAAMANLNEGGWTDFVMQIKFDGRNVAEGGSGYINVWMRPEGGSWVQIANIYPDITTSANGMRDVAHGIMYKGSGPGAIYGYVPTLYMSNDRVLGLSTNGHLFHFDNMKLGNDTATFEELSHDGSSPQMNQKEQPAAPNPPVPKVE